MSWIKVGKIEPTIEEKKCTFCKNCFEACPQGVFAIDRTNNKIVIANVQECIVCLHCEEACQTGALFVKGAIRKKWKVPPIRDMWGFVGVIPPG